LILAILLVGVCAGLALAQPTIHGPISGTIGPGTYIVDGNLTVNAGASATIAPGTSLLFSGHYSLKVYGTLTAVGTQADSILFVRQSMTPTCEWSGLRFMAGATPNSVVSYALFEGARYQVWPDYNGGAIYSTVAVNINHCYIQNCYSSSGGAMYLTAAPATISDCIIINCSAGNGGGIYLYSAHNTTISNTAVARNSATST
jgi:hypothetical protein